MALVAGCDKNNLGNGRNRSEAMQILDDKEVKKCQIQNTPNQLIFKKSEKSRKSASF